MLIELFRKALVCQHTEPQAKSRTPCNINSKKRTGTYSITPASSLIEASQAIIEKNEIVPLNIHPSIRSSILLTHSIPDIFALHSLTLSKSNEPMTFDTIIRFQVDRTIWATSRSIGGASFQYFQGIRTWLPIISQRLFQEDPTKSNHAPPSAHSSMLLLSIDLFT